MRVTSSTGQPGAEDFRFRIRGQGTWTGTGADPLILINGIEGDLNTLDPYRIETISVLKDAASASVYGARASNGVILVTTKNGEEQKDRFSVFYRGNYAVHQATGRPDLIWNSPDYMKSWNQARKNSGRSESEMYTGDMIAAYTHPADTKRYPGFNWLDYMSRRPFVHQHNLNMPGTHHALSYNVSLHMVNQPGT